MNTIQLNERRVITGKCVDPIDIDDPERNSKKYLKKSFDNILIVIRDGDRYIVDCFKRSYIADLIKHKTSVKNCKQKDSVNTYEELYPIPLHIGSFHVLLEDLQHILDSNYRIYYLELKERGGYICQGRDTDIYSIKVCGGDECLPKIFGPHPQYVLREIQQQYPEEVIEGNDWSVEMREAILEDDVDRFDRITEEIRERGGDVAQTINESVGEDMEPILIYAIKNGALDIVNMMVQEGASLEVEDEGVTPLVAAIFFTDEQEFTDIITNLLNLRNNLNSYFTRFQLDIPGLMDKEIRLRRSGRFDNIFDLLNRYPDLEGREMKKSFLRRVYDANNIEWEDFQDWGEI